MYVVPDHYRTGLFVSIRAAASVGVAELDLMDA